MNCIINLDSIFFNNSFRVILSVFSLFFIDFIRHFKLANIYRSNIITKSIIINSFHIRNSVQNFQSRPNLKVINVCKKNCSISQITNISHSNFIRKFIGFEQILDHRDVSFFMFF